MKFGSCIVGQAPTKNADLRIRIVRRRLRCVWRTVHTATAAFGCTADQLPCLQEARPEGLLHLQLTKNRLDFGRQKSRLYGFEKGQQGRVRETVGNACQGIARH